MFTGPYTWHTGFSIDANDEYLLIWGDIVHYPHIQSAQPDVSILFDSDPAQAKKTKKCIMRKAANEKLIIAGMHMSQSGLPAFLERVVDTAFSKAKNE
ncbi:hypothetical protein I9P40_19450 [Citrobacter portucalensis]|uniref:hypothetical protein n=1 Tax=Citrobacter portucalensis TaxID=1639133 RepID=UPI001E64B951|nr:hypothetical protein [Citrobacter portucalensis]UMB86189.1 hypothetical protein I9P40_19450 [Citrobacter portucalensis]